MGNQTKFDSGAYFVPIAAALLFSVVVFFNSFGWVVVFGALFTLYFCLKVLNTVDREMNDPRRKR